MHETRPSALATSETPGHWLLAKLGKRVLRPGGMELTRELMRALNVGPNDDVVEFAPGLGVTAKLTIARGPASYTAVERDPEAANIVRRQLAGAAQQCVIGTAEDTGLDDEAYDVVYGEAMLSMQPPDRKIAIVREACRLLKLAGRYGIHELCLTPDDIDDKTKKEISKQMALTIRHGAQLLTTSGWKELLTSQGFVIRDSATASMHLLEPKRMISDEGLLGTLRFARNLLMDREARQRVRAMRGVFRKFGRNLSAIMLVGVKAEQP